MRAYFLAVFGMMPLVQMAYSLDCAKVRDVASYYQGECAIVDTCMTVLTASASTSTGSKGKPRAPSTQANAGFEESANDGFVSNSGFGGNDGFSGNDGFIGNASNAGFASNDGFIGDDSNSGFASNDGFLAGANTGFEADANDGFANSGFVADADDATNREDFFTQAAGFLDGVVQFINGISNVLGLGKKPESAPEAPHAQDDGVKQPVYIPLALCKSMIECGEFGPSGSFTECLPEDSKTPQCQDDWIGDGVCDEPCNTEKYDKDGGDC